MKRYFTVLLILIAVCFRSGWAGSEDQCVVCHSRVKPHSHPAHSFEEWQKSVHAKVGVSCQACHGGNPAATQVEPAHQGILKSTQEESPIFFNQIPETCGACHRKELEGFKGSAHSKELHRSGKGPNCVTCHGSMAAQTLSPREMETICTLCHRKPTQAYAALIALQTSEKLMDQLQKQLAGTSAQDLSAQSDTLKGSRKTYQAALHLWHTFDMAKVIVQAQNLNHSLRNAIHELELKKKQ